MSQLGFDDLRAQVSAWAEAAKGSAAFAHVCADAELARIDHAERHGDRSVLDGDLAGWIIPAKDLHDVAGMPTSRGSVSLTAATGTDPFIASYMARGALVVAKTQTSEYGLSAYCEPANADAPTWKGHTSGGSSGGAAVAVAAGLVDAAHATDGGGSIRVPAAATGTVGFKPVHDTRAANPVAQGFITRTVAEQALLHLIAPELSRPLRIGLLTEPIHIATEVDPAIVDATHRTAELLSHHGHTITRLNAPYGAEHFHAFTTVIRARAATIAHPATELVQWLSNEGRAISSGELAQAQRVFASTRAVVERAWDVDVVLMPTISHAPPPVGYFSSMDPHSDFEAQTKWTPWATLFNLTGQAAITAPVFGIGIQLGGIRASEAELLALAATVEGAHA